MTVQEVVAILGQYPPDAEVFATGEGTVDNVLQLLAEVFATGEGTVDNVLQLLLSVAKFGDDGIKVFRTIPRWQAGEKIGKLAREIGCPWQTLDCHFKYKLGLAPDRAKE